MDEFEEFAREADLADTVAPRSRVWLRAALFLALGIGCLYVVADLIERIDWSLAWDALTTVKWWELVILFAMLVVRQVLNARPLALFLPELSLTRATICDQATSLLSMIAPPPADMVLRIKILHSWGIEPARGLAGATMNILAFYINRLLVPLVGFVLFLTVEFYPAYLVIAVVSVAIGCALTVATLLAARSEKSAAAIGIGAGKLARRVKKSVDPQTWAEKILDYRSHIAGRFGWAIPRALLGLLVMTMLDGCILAVTLRFVGVPADDLPIWAIVGAFLVLFPLTILPLQGFGVLDGVLLATYVGLAGEQYEAAVLAALMLYRVITLGGPMLLGCGALAYWHHPRGRVGPR